MTKRKGAIPKNLQNRRPDGTPMSIEESRPDDVAEAIMITGNPLIDNFSRAARECGLNHSLIKKIRKKLEMELLPVKLAVEEAKTQQLLSLTADRARRVIESVTQENIDEASLRDKAVAFGILVEKRQLLSGEPTHLIGIQDRRHLSELTQKMVLEAQRRGIVIDVSPVDGSVHCQDEIPTPEGPPAMHHGERRKITP